MNFKGLAEQLEMEETEYLEIMELFLETSVTNLGELQSAVEGKDAQSAFRAAHSIKGAAANLRLNAIFELAQRDGKGGSRESPGGSHRGDPGHPGEFEPDR